MLNSGIKDGSGNSLESTSFSFTTGDFTNPTVSMITPSNNATNVSTAQSVTLAFSEAVTGVNTNNVELHVGASDGALIPITQIIAGANNTYTFSSATPLKEQTTYYVILRNEGITDEAGLPLASSEFLKFTTGDFTAPTVTMVSPSDNATNLSTASSISVVFSETVTNVNSSNVELHAGSANGALIPITQIVAGANNTYTFSSVTSLSEQTTYYVVFKDNIKDAANNSLASTSFSFTTGDFTAPTAEMTSPSNNAFGISKTPNITIQFSETVTNVDSSNVTLIDTKTGNPVGIGPIVLGADNVYTFSPINALNDSTLYKVELKNGIKDSTNNSLASTSFGFTTGDFTAPTVNMVTPSDNATNLSTSSSITIVFSEAVTGVDINNVKLVSQTDGSPVVITQIIAGANNTYTFSSAAPLDESTKYHVEFKNGIKDAANNSLSPIDFSFTTGEFTAPTVDMTGPINNASNVSRSSSITIKFSEAVIGVDSTNVTLVNTTNNTSTPIGPILPGQDNTYTFSSVSDLNDNTLYKVELSSNIKDVSNNSLVPIAFSFTTGDFTVPTVSMVNPADNATNISTSSIISLSFSESVLNVNATNVIVKNSSGTPIAVASITGGASTNNVYTVTMNTKLDEKTKYSVELKNAITDTATPANALEAKSFSFTTGDFTNPTVNMNTPTNNNTSVIGFPIITLEFSESVLGVSATSVKLYKDSLNGTPVQISTPILGSNPSPIKYTFSPKTQLSADTHYYLTVSDTIKDTSANANKLIPKVFYFKTGSDVESGTVDMTSPVDGDTGVNLAPTITLQSSENLARSTVIAANIKLLDSTGNNVAIKNVSYDANTDLITFNPSNSLTEQSTYTVRVTDGVTDTAGNKIVPAEFEFTTGDFTYPVATLVSPANGADVVVDTTVIVSFPENVNHVDNTTFFLTYYNGTTNVTVPATVTSASGYDWELTPDVNLHKSVNYTVNLTAAIKDDAGNSVGLNTGGANGAKFYFSTVNN